MTQHSSLTPEHRARFSKSEQLLQIGAEMQRALEFLRADRFVQLRACYERAVQLVDLISHLQHNRNLRREPMIWRDFVVELSRREEPDPETHPSALKAVLHLDLEASNQVSILGL